MALVLAIEPDPRQAATLKAVVRAGVHAKLVVVDSKDAALASIAACVPDLILVTALLPPRDEDDLTRRLKTLEHAAHLQTLTIPMFARAPAEQKLGSRAFSGFRRKKRAAPIDGCDPNVFRAEIEAYLQHAARLRDEQRVQEARQAHAQETQPPPILAAAEPSIAAEESPIAAQDPSAAQEPVTLGPIAVEAVPVASQDVGTARVEIAAERPPVQTQPIAAAPAPTVDEPAIVEHVPGAASELQLGAPRTSAVTADAKGAVETEDADDAEWQVVPLDDQNGETASGTDIAIQDAIPELSGEAIETASDAGTQSVVAIEQNARGEGDRAALTTGEAVPEAQPEQHAPAPAAVAAEARPDDVEQPVLAPAEHEAAVAGAKRATASEGVHAAFNRALGNLHAFAERVSTRIKSRSPATLNLHDDSESSATTGTAEVPPDARVAAPVRSGPAAVRADEDDGVDATHLAVRSEQRHEESAVGPASDDGHQPAGHDEMTRTADAGRQAVVAVAQKPAIPGTAVGQSNDCAFESPEEEHDKAAARKKARRRRRRRRSHVSPPLPPGLEAALAGADSRWLTSAIAALRFDIQQLREETRTTGTTAASVQPAQEAHAGDATSHQDSRAAPGDGEPDGHGDGTGNGNGHAHVEGASQQPDPAEAQDEWGLYNPERCGIQALFARLEQHDAATAEPPATQTSPAHTGDLGNAQPADCARMVPQTPDLKRLAPLSMWARVDEQVEYRVEDILPKDPLSRAAGSTAASRLLAEVAAVRYGSGCRIHRIRIAPGPKQSAADERQVIILSRKALDELR